MAKKEKFAIIDGNALLHRAWHALPPLTTKGGQVVNALYGFIMVLFKALKELKPKYLCVAFDKKGPTFRHKLFKEYKIQRIKQPPELYQQIDLIKEFLKILNIPYFEKEGYEADDLIASLCKDKEVDNPQIESIILTGDLDTLQLVDENTKVYTLKRGISETMIYDQRAVEERFGLSPSQLKDFKALRGDPSDNIPGVKGIGEKTAIDLIKEFGSLEELYKHLKNKTKKAQKIKAGIREKLLAGEKEAFLSKKLITLEENLPLPFSLKDCQLEKIERNKLISFFKKFEFKSLISRIPEVFVSKEESSFFEKEKREEVKYQLIRNKDDLKEFLLKAKRKKEIVIDTETTSLDPFKAQFLGLSFSFREKEAFFLDWRLFDKRIPQEIKKILENPQVKKIGHNLKYDLAVLDQLKINLFPLYFDTMIASYLLNPGARAHNLDDLVFKEFGYKMFSFEELTSDGKIKMEDLPSQKLAWYSCEDADFTWRLFKRLEKELKKDKLWKLFQEIEMPLVPVLYSLEKNGVKIDERFLKKLSQETQKELSILEKRIFQLAGEEFNINSPQQLKVILFEKLKIFPGKLKKTKTGISTAASELEKLRGKHPIIDLIFRYRELMKLKTTYIEALPQLINSQTGRVHTSFNQTITATGRLSSSNPNLQNIPIKTDLGKKIRQAFIAERGYKLLSADYSQIELRILAFIAKDKAMIDSFKRGEDIHRKTAQEIWNLKKEEVSSHFRRMAKTINFGVAYGMGPHGLAQSAKISYEEAKKFIEKYFLIHKGIKNYISQIISKAKRDGYVETLFGRRRYLPEIHSRVPQLQAMAERMAINMPIQGTAADLMKKAMINIYQRIKKLRLEKEIKMILQVHDELVFEIKKERLKEAIDLIRKEMEGVYELPYPLEVNLKVGDNWDEMEEIDRG